MSISVHFVERASGPERLVCDAELHLDDAGPASGLKLVGFSLWRSAEGEIFVSLPARAFGAGGERRYFDLLRANGGGSGSVKAFKAWVLDQYASHTEMQREIRRQDAMHGEPVERATYPDHQQE